MKLLSLVCELEYQFLQYLHLFSYDHNPNRANIERICYFGYLLDKEAPRYYEVAADGGRWRTWAECWSDF